MNEPFHNHSRNGAVVTVGRLYCDLVFTGIDAMPRLGRETFAKGLSMSAGGGAYITAAYLAALDRPTALCATLPQEPFASIVLPEIERNGLDISHLDRPSPDDDVDPQITVAMVSDDDRAFLTRKVGSAVPTTIRAALMQPNLTHLHIGELATLLERPDLIAMARDHNLTLSLDCSWSGEAIANDKALSLIAATDIFMPNEVEATALFGDPEGDLIKAAKELAALPCLTTIKCGPRGAGIATQIGLTFTPAPVTEVVDTTGAGDAFNAGFLDAWLAGESQSRCLEQGIRCGSFAVTQHGGATVLPQRQQPARQSRS